MGFFRNFEAVEPINVWIMAQKTLTRSHPAQLSNADFVQYIAGESIVQTR